jgi:hypothetical protein
MTKKRKKTTAKDEVTTDTERTDEVMATDEASREPTGTEPTAEAPKAKKEGTVGRGFKLFGLTSGLVMRWMGFKGYTLAEVRHVVASQFPTGGGPADASITTCRSEGLGYAKKLAAAEDTSAYAESKFPKELPAEVVAQIEELKKTRPPATAKAPEVQNEGHPASGNE